MTKGMRKDFQREIKLNFSRFLSITLIVVLGVAFFSGLRAAKPAMQASADKQYDSENLMDIRVAGTLGMTDKDVDALKKVDGVQDAEGTYEQDFLCDTGNSEAVTKVMSLNDGISLVRVSEGRFPQGYNECIADRSFLDATGYKIGDTVKLTTGTDEKVSKYLATDEFTIVGVGTTSMYMDSDRGSAAIGTGRINGFLIVPKQAFTMSCYTSVHITVKDAMALGCYSSDYTELISKVKDRINGIADRRCDIRYSEYKNETATYINDAKLKFEEEKDTAMGQLGDAYQQLLDAQAAIETGKADLASKKLEIQNAQDLINSNANTLVVSQSQIDNAKASLVDAEKKYKELESQVSDSAAEIERMQKELDDGKGSMSSDEYLQKSYNLIAAKATLQFYKTQLANTRSTIDNAKQQVAAAQTAVNNGGTALQDAQKKVNEAPAALEEAEKQIQDAQIELDRKNEEYEQAKQDLADELEAAQQKLEDSEDKILNVEKPTWYVLDRETIPSYTAYKSDTDGMGSIGSVFPVIFFLVAALVSLTTMTRMVEEQRTQIGTLKALGYTKGAIAAKYVLYALLATAIGSVLGVLLGESTIPLLTVNTYKLVYIGLHNTVVKPDVFDALLASLLAIICTTGATLAACYRVLSSSPALLMRPEAPKAGKRILLEKVGFIWKHLNFAQKAACRNLFRYKKRLFMTIAGVAGCMALLLVGFGLNDSIKSMTGNQFEKVWHFAGTAGINSEATRAEKRQSLAEVNTMNGVTEYLQTYRSMLYTDANGEEKTAYVIVPQDTSRMADYVNLSSRDGKNTYVMDDSGVIITEKLAKTLGVSVGDTVTFKTSETGTATEPVKVAGIVENYMYHYIYMTPNVYKQLFNETASLNTIFIKTDGTVDDETLSKQLMDLSAINSVSMNSTTEKQISSVMNSLLFIVVILIVAAGLLAFVVLYNLNNINITERRRELATLKVLGFYNKELAFYVYRENIVLTIFGVIFGIVLGIILHAYVMSTIETDYIMFGKEMTVISYLASILLTVLFTAIVNFVMYFRLKKIDMVESLKSAE